MKGRYREPRRKVVPTREMDLGAIGGSRPLGGGAMAEKLQLPPEKVPKVEGQ